MLLFCTGALLASCVFDAAGIDPDDAARLDTDATTGSEVLGEAVPADDAPADRSTVEGAPAPDGPGSAPPDQRPLDQTPLPNQGSPTPLSSVALGQALAAAKVPCVTSSGSSTSAQIPIVDSAKLTYFSASVTLAGAASDTLAWVGGKPSITILWDPNACGPEEKPGDTNWDTAGLLIRGATLDAKGALLLAPKTTVKAINLVNIEGNGAWQDDVAKPDDSGLSGLPQLVNPVNLAKQIIVSLGLP